MTQSLSLIICYCEAIGLHLYISYSSQTLVFALPYANFLDNFCLINS